MNQHPNNGGPAFPLQVDISMNSEVQMGMSLRDYFAGQAMASIMSADIETHQGLDQIAGDLGISTDKLTAESAYSLADAMLAAREKGGKV